MESLEKQGGLSMRKKLILFLLTQLCSADISTLLEINTLLRERRSVSSETVQDQVRITINETLEMGEKVGG